MEIITIEETRVRGISARIRMNSKENEGNAQFHKLWGDFASQIAPKFELGSRCFGVYYDYNPENPNEFSHLAGSDKVKDSADLEEVRIAGGTYMVFRAEGPIPECVTEAWDQVMAYFSRKNIPHSWLRGTDFELYKSETEVEVYIAIA